jgi:ABC-type polysaccharide/polyol phosphate transport system ATPase subunit
VSRPAIIVDNLHKAYRIYKKPSDVLVEGIAGKRKHTLHEALKGVSFEVNRGEVLGILGRNGAGKSTLLKVMTGAISPTSGSVTINGRISQMLELGTGFDLEATGAENIYLGGFCLGMSRKEIDRKYDSIVAFSELADFMDRPFRTYSLGMQARLTFAVAIHVDPEVLIIDEWLAVGDARFAMKCYERIRKFREQGSTVVFVTHNYSTVTEFCDKGLILDNGSLHFIGPPEEAVYRYSKLLFGESKSHAEPGSTSAANTPVDQQIPVTLNRIAHDFSNRFGEGGARMLAVSIINAAGEVTPIVPSGERFTIRFHVRIETPIPELVVGLYVKDRVGRVITSTTNHCFPDLPRLTNVQPGEMLVDIQGSMTLSTGYYFLGTTLGKPDGQKYDLVDGIVMLEVINSPGVLNDSVVNFFPKISVREATNA